MLAFDKLARLIKEEGEDIREEMGSMEKRLERKMDEGFCPPPAPTPHVSTHSHLN